ncbi:tetratricopeptide repeat protein [Burkholderia thailandensis]|uniref:tetratricopeptide repeat protein n=1 Tax=Burkholderia thailandensis TaxID=57975 RepID=UPI0003EC780B|nr:tetratricopeptide repeat protein [Burkholderia thailandensis]AHI80278.1 sel1 repeat family protein [Burkholderia thailandensis E444]AIC85931.1 sel1 repeat family protein [Burkholderia thailandensis USAMRU Malaysia \
MNGKRRGAPFSVRARHALRGAAAGALVSAAFGAAAGGAFAQASGAPGRSNPGRETESAVADYNAGSLRAALVQFHDAAARGNRLAAFDYAMMLINGEGVTANVPEGLRWLRRAADAGMSQAQYVYGRMLDDGEFVARDPAVAHVWFLKAARQGHVQAELALANQFLDGRGTQRDNRQAFAWYKRAADAGEPVSQYVTASFYERGGDGVTRNLDIARAYYAAAAAQGDDAAALKYRELTAVSKAGAGGGAAPKPSN